MNAYLIMILSAGIGQFLLVLSPGLVRALIQLAAGGASPRELLPLPGLLAFGALLSFGFLSVGRRIQRRLREEHRAGTGISLRALRNGDRLWAAWNAWRGRQLLLGVDLPVLLVRLAILLFFMFVEDWRFGICGAVALPAGAWSLHRVFRGRRSNEAREEGLELHRVLVAPIFPGLACLALLASAWQNPAGAASLFLFFGLMLEVSFGAEQWFRDWHALPALQQPAARLRELEAALGRVSALPAGRVAFVAPDWSEPGAGIPEGEGPTLWITGSENEAREHAHLVWRAGKLEVLA